MGGGGRSCACDVVSAGAGASPHPPAGWLTNLDGAATAGTSRYGVRCPVPPLCDAAASTDVVVAMRPLPALRFILRCGVTVLVGGGAPGGAWSSLICTRRARTRALRRLVGVA